MVPKSQASVKLTPIGSAVTCNAFGEDQVLFGTISGGVPTVQYDLTGFFTNDAPTILSTVQPGAWEAI